MASDEDERRRQVQAQAMAMAQAQLGGAALGGGAGGAAPAQPALPEDEDAAWDEFVDKWQVKYTGDWDVEECPLFATSSSDPETNEGLSAMQSLLYDDPPEMVAENFKDQGNKKLKYGKLYWPDAAQFYSRAIEAANPDPLANSVYYSNRAHVYVLMGNNGYAIADAKKAIELNPQNIKAFYRGAKAALALDKLDKVDEFLAGGFALDKRNDALLKVKAALAKKRAAIRAKQERKRQEAEMAARQTGQMQDAIRERGIQIGRPFLAGLATYQEFRVRLDPATGLLHWPVVLLYPEHSTSDFVQDWTENQTFQDHLGEVLAEPAPWDPSHSYRPETVEVVFVTNCTMPFFLSPGERSEWESRKRSWKAIDPVATLHDILTSKLYVVPGACPCFFVVRKGSKFAAEFLVDSKIGNDIAF